MTKNKIIKQLKEVIDPELGFNIVDLGLVYDAKVKPLGKGVKVIVVMTLTSPGCPLASVIHEGVEKAVMKLKEVEDVELELVWDPPWSIEKASREVRIVFGM